MQGRVAPALESVPAVARDHSFRGAADALLVHEESPVAVRMVGSVTAHHYGLPCSRAALQTSFAGVGMSCGTHIPCKYFQDCNLKMGSRKETPTELWISTAEVAGLGVLAWDGVVGAAKALDHVAPLATSRIRGERLGRAL